MPFTAGAVIDQARSRHASFHPTRHPNKVALVYLSAYARGLHGKLAAIDAALVRSQLSTALPLATFANGIALPSNRLVDEVWAVRADGTEMPVNLVPVIQRNDPQTGQSAAWQVGTTLYLKGPESAWTGLSSIQVAYAAYPTALSTLDDQLTLPDFAELACVEAVAAFLARRGGADAGQDKPDAGAFSSWASDAEGMCLADAVGRLAGTRFETRDTYRP